MTCSPKKKKKKVKISVQIHEQEHLEKFIADMMSHIEEYHYTAHKNRNGIKKTTSIVDNFLKTVKRKLRQVESFRDQEWAGISFRAMANIRNFAPFMSGAKNAHKSPFMLAQGQTFNLPWIQVMNVHNAFLFG